ncbi:MAG: hypothetical protein ABIK92_17280 [Pseudomonadota bacterium]
MPENEMFKIDIESIKTNVVIPKDRFALLLLLLPALEPNSGD